jgi:hypothetical protein
LRPLGDEAHRLRIGNLDLLDQLELRTHIGGRFLAGDLLDRPFHVIGRDRLAVVEDTALAQLEDPGPLGIARPGLGELAAQLALGIIGDQAAVDQHLDGAGRSARRDPGLQVRRKGREAVADDAGGALRARGADQEGRGQQRAGKTGTKDGTARDGHRLILCCWVRLSAGLMACRVPLMAGRAEPG